MGWVLSANWFGALVITVVQAPWPLYLGLQGTLWVFKNVFQDLSHSLIFFVCVFSSNISLQLYGGIIDK